jgi:hypothetical protein
MKNKYGRLIVALILYAVASFLIAYGYMHNGVEFFVAVMVLVFFFFSDELLESFHKLQRVLMIVMCLGLILAGVALSIKFDAPSSLLISLAGILIYML